MTRASDLVKTDNISSLEGIIDELIRLKKTLRKQEARQFLVFNDAYLVVTSNIKQASQAGYFENPKFIEKFSVVFAHYYFRAINHDTQDKPLPHAWQALHKAKQRHNTPNFVLLLLGANAHINHDLALALAKLMEHEETDDLLRDVVRLDKILMKSGREIITTFDEPSKLLDFLKRRVIFLYYRPTMYMIRFWRVRAYARYRSIKNKGLENSNYATGSVKIARRFLRLARVVS